MDAEAQSIVLSFSPENRGEAWIVMQRCIASFNPERGRIGKYFSRVWWNHQRKERKKLTKGIRSRRLIQWGQRHLRQPQNVTQYTTPDLPSNIPAELHLSALGFTYKQIAYSLGLNESTIKKRVRNYKRYLGVVCEP